jgi:hypothetical protein
MGDNLSKEQHAEGWGEEEGTRTREQFGGGGSKEGVVCGGEGVEVDGEDRFERVLIGVD